MTRTGIAFIDVWDQEKRIIGQFLTQNNDFIKKSPFKFIRKS